MNALLRKEVRLLLPGWLLVLLLALAWWVVPRFNTGSETLRGLLILLPALFCPVLLVTMTMASFGREFSGGTFSMLLAQPVSRSRVWRTKTLLLAAAVLSAWVVWWVSFVSSGSWVVDVNVEHQPRLPLLTLAVVIAAYSGGLWSVLLFRQVAAAFWFTLLVPAFLCALVAGTLDQRYHASDSTIELAVIAALVLYGAAGFLFARRLFLRAQDAHWLGDATLALPEVRGISRWLRRAGNHRKRRPLAALWLKEFQLHRSLFALAGLFLALHLAVLVWRKVAGDLRNSPATEFLLEHFWVLWTTMPWLAGSAAVAEERKLGTLEGQLCLPARRRAQFVIKFAATLLVSLLLGAVMPMLLEGSRVLPDFHLNLSNISITTPEGKVIPMFGWYWNLMIVLLPALAFAAIAVVNGAVSFYASTFTRNTLQAIAPAAAGIIATWFLFFGAGLVDEVAPFPLWRGPLIHLIGMPVLTLTVLGLMYWNFPRVLVGGGLWRRNAFVLLLALAGIGLLTTALYHRAWEHFVRLEPPHDPARLTRGSPLTLRSQGFNLMARLPDGRAWSGRYAPAPGNWVGGWKLMETTGGGRHLEGTNWADVALCSFDVAAIRDDGSLWVSETPQTQLGWPLPAPVASPAPRRWIRLGQDTDWKNVVPHQGFQAMLLKTNGTLWLLGTNRVDHRLGWPGLRAFQPQPLGTHSNWAEISSDGWSTSLRSQDGKAWSFVRDSTSRTDEMIVDGPLTLYRVAPWIEQTDTVSATWVYPKNGPMFRAGVLKDGTFQLLAVPGFFTGGRSTHWNLNLAWRRLDAGTNWLAVAGNQDGVMTLRADGTLWRWRFEGTPLVTTSSTHSKQVSNHSDWVAIADCHGGVVSLAADGGLWFWRFQPSRYSGLDSAWPRLLAASRRPQFLGNLLDDPAP